MDIALLISGLIIAGLYAIAIGGNDMANIIGVVVGSRIVKYKIAVLLFCFSVIAGAILQGHMVMKTLGRGVVASLDIYGALAASIAAITWVFVATMLGLPVSTSQSAAAGVFGVGLAYVFQRKDWTLVNFTVIERIVLSWVASPLLAIILSILTYLLLEKLYKSRLLSEKMIKSLGLIFASFDGYAFGANDVGNATGVYVAIVGASVASSILAGLNIQLILAIYGALLIATGGALLGRKVTETVGLRITKLDPIGSLTSSLVSSTSTWVFTTIPYILLGFGMPVSTTYITVATVIGVGIAKHRSLKGVDLRVVSVILLSWILTLPAGALIGLTTYLAMSNIKGV
ncbi:MAG: inorganic phosphate transporter [Desulfurococcaceae archaeon]